MRKYYFGVVWFLIDLRIVRLKTCPIGEVAQALVAASLTTRGAQHQCRTFFADHQ